MSVKTATIEYQRTNDIYSDFLTDCIEKEEKSTLGLEDTFKLFKDWWKDNYQGKAPSRKDMKGCIEKKLGKYIQRVGWRGYRIIVHNDDNDLDGHTNDEECEPIIATGQISTNLGGLKIRGNPGSP